jgi:hypothetical protein
VFLWSYTNNSTSWTVSHNRTESTWCGGILQRFQNSNSRNVSDPASGDKAWTYQNGPENKPTGNHFYIPRQSYWESENTGSSNENCGFFLLNKCSCEHHCSRHPTYCYYTELHIYLTSVRKDGDDNYSSHTESIQNSDTPIEPTVWTLHHETSSCFQQSR